MGSINLDEVKDMEVGTSKDWLGVEWTIQACSTTASMTKDQPNEQDQNQQNDSDLLLLDPDFQGADA